MIPKADSLLDLSLKSTASNPDGFRFDPGRALHELLRRGRGQLKNRVGIFAMVAAVLVTFTGCDSGDRSDQRGGTDRGHTRIISEPAHLT